MSEHIVEPAAGSTAGTAADAARSTRDWTIATAAMVVALLALWAVFFDNGQAVAATGEETFDVTLEAGEYTFVCDPHADSMKGSFTVS